MENKIAYPHDDEYMVFDPILHRYVLTESAITNHVGINVRQRIEVNPTVDATVIIKQITRRVSELVYSYIHQFAFNTARQDELIATVPSLRPIMFEALCQQMQYFLHKGDLSHSVNLDERSRAIDETAKDTLARYVPELGNSIIYAGG